MAHPTTDPRSIFDRLLVGGPTSDEESTALWRMSVEERVAAMRRGDLSLRQLTEWSSARPDQVPLIGGEFEYVVVRTPEWLGADG